MRTFSSYQKDFATFTGNASVTANTTNSYDNLTWGMRMINDAIRYLATVFYFNETSYIVPGGTVAQQQGYTLPDDFESLMNITVAVGTVLYQPTESPSRRHFDALNVIQFYNDFPQFFYIFNGQVLLYPTPASNNNVITIHYKRRIVDLSMSDVTDTTATATLSASNGDATITASSAAFKAWMGNSGWLQIPDTTTDASSGDNRWYQIDTITSTTALELKNPYRGKTITGAGFLIGDVPILPEDYQDLPLYKALRLYFSTRVPDSNKANTFKDLYDSGYQLLDNKYGSKSNSPVLTDTNAQVYNPNLFPQSLTKI